MRKIILDTEQMRSQSQLHQYLREALQLPAYYGANLDALYDCLTELSEPTELTIQGKVAEEAYLGRYGAMLLRVLQDAAAANRNLQITVQP
ncbi:barstar family protein [uncultured Phascolarctobacterium sp.]|uniref:barstar family protein n=1 Tax=uncultured Phascolarctobacterium sp. TaxID=512296 RepID=UPI0025FA6663|nr:barstar family protein [uncultured Phascolarctobacterium sp.]